MDDRREPAGREDSDGRQKADEPAVERLGRLWIRGSRVSPEMPNVSRGTPFPTKFLTEEMRRLTQPLSPRIREQIGIPKIFEQNPRVIPGSRMLRVDGRIQREGVVAHLIACRGNDLSSALVDLGDRDTAFPVARTRR